MLALLAVPAVAGAQAAGPGQEARRAFNRLVSAANRLDAEAENDAFWRSPELVSIAQGTATYGWEERAEKTRRWYGALKRQKIRPQSVETRALGSEAVALVSAYAQEIEAKDGRRWEGEGVWSLVFRRIDGAWRIVWEHYSYEERGRW